MPTEPTHIQGTRDTLTIEQSRRIPDVDDKIYILEPNESPLTAFLTQIGKIGDGGGRFKGQAMQKRVVHNPEFTEYEDQYSGVWAKINNGAGYTAGDTALVVDTPGGSIFTKYDLVKVTRTGEIMRVTAVNYGTNTITVTRGAGSTAAAALLDNDDLFILGNAFEEGSRSGDSNTTKLVKVTNFTQIFKTKFGVTGTEDSSDLYPKDASKDIKYLRAKMGIEHAKKIERAYWFGEKKEVTGPDGKPLRLTGGILDSIETTGNVQDEASSALTQAEFTTFLRDYAFIYGSSEKYLFCGNIIMGALDGFYTNQIRVHSGEKTYGVMVRQYTSSFGVLNIVRHPMFDRAPYNGYGVVVDLSTLKHCPLQSRDTMLETNIQERDADERVDQYKSETGLQRVNFEKNAILKGVV